MKIAIARTAALLAVFICVHGYAQSPQETSNADKVIQGLNLSAPYKTGTVEYFNLNHRFPNSNQELAMAPLPDNAIVQRVDVSTPDANSRTVITITYGSWAGANNVLTMTGWAMEGGVQFTCGGAGSTLPDEWRPKACKAAA